MDLVKFPAAAGTYCLLLGLKDPAQIQIGRLGTFAFPAGPYLYLGSAMGPGGLAGRLHHHLSTPKRPHWHIDYLLTHRDVRVNQVQRSSKEECVWNQTTSGKIIVPGFGASDCRAGCGSHLKLVG